MSATPVPGVTNALAPLRGLRTLSHPAELRPIIAVDSREQNPLAFTRLPSVIGTLYSGDYSIRGAENIFAVERKSLDDIANCSSAGNRERFARELHRLRGYRFKRLLVIGTRGDIAAGQYHSKINPKAVLATLGAFEIRFDLPVVHVASPEAAAHQIERWTFWFCREVLQNSKRLCSAQPEAAARMPSGAPASLQDAF